MVNVAALRAAQPGLLDRASGDWQALSTRLGSQVSALRSDVLQPLFDNGDWAGAAANAARANLSNLSGELSVTQDYAKAMTSLLRDAASGIQDAQSWLQAADNLAAQNNLTIGADGTVSAAPAPPLLAGSQPASLLTAAPSPAIGEVADLVGRALAVADDVDAQITARLQQLQKFAETGAAGQLAGADRLAIAFDRAALPPQGTSPAEVSDWWQALDKGQQQRLITEFPAQIGWMNGLPAQARSQANTIVMETEETRLTHQLGSLNADQPSRYLKGRFGSVTNPAWETWQGQVSRIKTELAGIASVESGLAYAASKAGAGNVFLLGFNTDGIGHAIVAVGNPDTAVNTVTYVPGLGTNLTNSAGNIGRATALWGQAERLAPGEKISSIYWLGYNAPQLGLSVGLHNLDVTSTTDAVAGGLALTQFESGLQAAHLLGTPDHTVVLGHSYGSLVVGEAAAHDGMHPGDIIVVGSPGVGVNNAAQLGESPLHVWAGENAHDPVPRLPPSDPVTAVTDPSAAHFGTNPASKAFGGQIFNADIDPSQSFSAGIDLSAHSAYWDPGSSSLLNMAHIVDGQYGSVSVGPQAPPNLESATSLMHDIGDLF
jgi:Alpha/beta hydrolase